MDADIISMLDNQTCSAQAHSILVEITSVADSQYTAFRRAFEYGRICGKREERARRKSIWKKEI